MEKASRVLGLYAGGFCFQPFRNLELEARQGRQEGREREREKMTAEWWENGSFVISSRILSECY